MLLLQLVLIASTSQLGSSVFQVYLHQGECAEGFPVDLASHLMLRLRDPHLLIQGEQKENRTGRIPINYNHQLSLSILHQSSDSADDCSEERQTPEGQSLWLAAFFLVRGNKPLHLLLFHLWPVSVSQFQQLSSCLAIQDQDKLGHLHPLVQAGPLQ